MQYNDRIFYLRELEKLYTIEKLSNADAKTYIKLFITLKFKETFKAFLLAFLNDVDPFLPVCCKSYLSQAKKVYFKKTTTFENYV
jgi:hypothetical protein